MIETKEQYERAMGKRIPLGLGTTIPDDMMDDIKETIEALREVVRAGRKLHQKGMIMPTPAVMSTSDEELPYHDFLLALAALPDWITEE